MLLLAVMMVLAILVYCADRGTEYLVSMATGSLEFIADSKKAAVDEEKSSTAAPSSEAQGSWKECRLLAWRPQAPMRNRTRFLRFLVLP